MSAEFNPLVEGTFPELKDLLECPDKVREWALAKVDADIKKEIAAGIKAHLEGRNADCLDSLVMLGEKEAVRDKILHGEADDSGFAYARWVEEARYRLELGRLLEQTMSPSPLRRSLARRALGAMDYAKWTS